MQVTAVIPARVEGNSRTTVAKPTMRPSACATEISPQANAQERLSM
jgi:hypothetical protein